MVVVRYLVPGILLSTDDSILFSLPTVLVLGAILKQEPDSVESSKVHTSIHDEGGANDIEVGSEEVVRIPHGIPNHLGWSL